MLGPITERDYLNPLSNFNTDMMMLGALLFIALVVIMGIAKWAQDRYEDDDNDPYEGPHVV